jgi:hypothetical protein
MGRLIRKDGTSEEIDLMPKIVSANNVSMIYNVDASGNVSGKTRKQYTNYNAMMFRDNIGDVKEDAYLEKLENDNNKIEISEYSRTNEKDLLLPVIETFSFSGNNLCEIIGDKIYIDPMLFLTDKKNPFTQENREYPVDYGFPSSDKYSINITIPDGFTVETLPASGGFAMENDLGLFKFISSVNGNILQVVITHQINEPVILPDDYSVLKEYYKGMIAKENEKIVLKRI